MKKAKDLLGTKSGSRPLTQIASKAIGKLASLGQPPKMGSGIKVTRITIPSSKTRKA